MNKKIILKASFKVIQKTGLEGFTMRELARELNCQPASIYHYYATKNDILNDLYMKIYNDFFKGLLEEAKGNLEDYLFKLCVSVQQYRVKYLFLIRHSYSSFLSKENIDEIKKDKAADLEKMRTFLNRDDLGVVDYLLMKGPINELAFLERKKLNEEEIKELVRRMIISIKGEL